MNLRDQLQAIYDQHGKLTPDIVLEEARDPKHPLHARFEWDNETAAENWRLEQAHQLIRSVRVSYRKEVDGTLGRVRAFHAIRQEDGYVYEPLDEVVASPMLSKILMQDMEREWKQLKRRYEEFEEFWQLVRGEVKAEAA